MATETSTHSDTQTGIELDAQIVVALTFGAVLGLVGVLGPALGGANGELLVFGRNYLHDAVHLGSGVLGLIAGYAAGGTHARTYNRTLGAVYLLVAALGFVVGDLLAQLLAVNMADNLLHLGLAVAFLGVGFALGDDW